MTKLTNSQGKVLYTNPESIKKAMGRRKDKIYGKGLLKYNVHVSLFTRERIHTLTI